MARPVESEEPGWEVICVLPPVVKRFDMRFFEYAIVQTVLQCCENEYHGTCKMTKREIADYVGLKEETVKKTIIRLKKNNHLIRNQFNELEVTDKFKDVYYHYLRELEKREGDLTSED